LQVRQRLLAGYARMRELAPERLAEVQSRLARYQTALDAASLTPELLPASGYRLGTVLRVSLRAIIALGLLLPLAVAGAILHAPGWFLIRVISRRFEQQEEDVVATVKALGGLLFYPLTWVALATFGGVRWGWPAGVAALALAPASGWAALRFLERLDWLTGGARGLVLALTGRARFLRLVAERRAIYEELSALGREYGI
jgi:hypothetical protein